MSRLTRSQQENLLALLGWTDHAPYIRAVVDADLFEGLYHEIAGRIYSYIDRFRAAPGDHVADELDDLLNADDPKRAETYRDILVQLHESVAGINAEYVLSTLRSFVRVQSFRAHTSRILDLLTADDDVDMDAVEAEFQRALQQRADVFDAGVRLSDGTRALNFLEERAIAVPTGVRELDVRNLGPKRKELHLLLAPKGAGKTWWLTHLGRNAIIQRQRVVHITLEVSTDELLKRYHQTFFALGTRDVESTRVDLERDELGRVIEFRVRKERPRLSVGQADIGSRLVTDRRKWSAAFSRLVIKEFPTKQLTYSQLCGYLDLLERTENFIPDLILIDYPRLMTIEGLAGRDAQRWSAIGDLYARLRGLFVERNIAGAVVDQLNRDGARIARTGTATSENVAEAWDIAAHADTVLTLNGTNVERSMGLARLYVDKARNEQDHFEFVITQDLAIGQFARSSAMLSKQYWGTLDKYKEQDSAAEEG